MYTPVSINNLELHASIEINVTSKILSTESLILKNSL